MGGYGSRLLQVRDLTVEVGGKSVVAGATFSVAPGDKAGLVGRNGAGKTSLLKVLSGDAEPAGGRVMRKGGLGYLSQEPRSGTTDQSASVLEHVLSGRALDEAAKRLERLRVAMEQEPTERAVARYARAEEAFRMDGGYAAEAEVHRICAGLGLDPARMGAQVGVLSGGERRRVELARILFAGSDVLLLDEPTNHLDADAKEWLLSFLRSYKGALVVISHDLALLDNSITRVLHLDRADGEGHIIEYRGTYTSYQRARAEDEARAERQADRQLAEVRRLSDMADRMRGQTAKRARTAKTLDKRAERLRSVIDDSGPTHQRQVRMRLPQPPSCGRTVIEVQKLAKGFGPVPLFEDVSFSLGRSERLLVMGLNGAGKTTLLRLIAGQLASDSGEIRFGLDVSAGYYAQEHEGLDPAKAALDHLREAADLSHQQARALIGMMGLSPDTANQASGTMSGGEKTKLALAQLVAGKHNLLLLDEPTNNLDPGSRSAVGEALAGWGGAMIVVSHDPEFVEALEPDLALVMPDGFVDRWSDDMADLVALA